MESTSERKLKSYQDIAEAFTEIGRMDIVQKSCDLGLTLNPLCSILKFFKGLSFYKKGMHDKSTEYFTQIVSGKVITYDKETKLLFQKHHVPFDEVFMESLREVHSKIRNEKILKISFLLIVIIIISLFCFNFL